MTNVTRTITAPGAGDCFITENLMGSASTVFKGVEPTQISLIDLSILLEAAVTHDQLLVVGFDFDNPFERLEREGILRCIRSEYSSLLKDGYKRSPQDFLSNAVHETYTMYKSEPWGSLNIAYVLPFDKSPFAPESIPDIAQKGFKAACGLLEAKERPEAFKDQAWFTEHALPGLAAYERYGTCLNELCRHYEISLYSGTCEQFLIDCSKLDSALPHSLLVKAYGEHFRSQLGSFVRKVPAPPFAGMVLGAATSISDIFDGLLFIRDKYARYRKSMTELREAMLVARKGTTTGDWMEYRRMEDELESVISESIRQIESNHRPTKKLVFRVWDLVKSGNPFKIFTSLLDVLIERDEARNQVLRVDGVYEVVRSFADITFLDSSAERLFGKRFEPEAIGAIGSGIGLLQSLYGVTTEDV